MLRLSTILLTAVLLCVLAAQSANAQFLGTRRGLGIQIAKPNHQFNIGLWGQGVQEPGVFMQGLTNFAGTVGPYVAPTVAAFTNPGINPLGQGTDSSGQGTNSGGQNQAPCKIKPVSSFDPNFSKRDAALTSLKQRQEKTLALLGITDHDLLIQPNQSVGGGSGMRPLGGSTSTAADNPDTSGDTSGGTLGGALGS